MPRTLQGARNFGGVVLLTLGTFGAAQAQISVSPVVTKVGALYHYDYSISNTSSSDLFDLDITVPTDASAGTTVIQNLTAPTGFLSADDSVLGLVSFLEDTGTFGPTPQDGFEFDSPFAPNSSSFTANLAPLSGGITTLNGSTLAPSVPEPGTFAAFGALAAAGIFAVRRKSRHLRRK